MANLDTEAKRRAALNYGMNGFQVSPAIDSSLDTEFDRRHMVNSYPAAVGNLTATGFYWDTRIMNRAISQSDGQATNSSNLGTVHYTYDDVKNNDAKVTLPFG